ncbi:hypothetical protein PMAYCL1PPCAC_04046, partial [Pristionchus mayeri]
SEGPESRSFSIQETPDVTNRSLCESQCKHADSNRLLCRRSTVGQSRLWWNSCRYTNHCDDEKVGVVEQVHQPIVHCIE